MKKMNIYICKDSDGGGRTLIVAESIKVAIDLFQKERGYETEAINNISADGELVIVQDSM